MKKLLKKVWSILFTSLGTPNEKSVLPAPHVKQRTESFETKFRNRRKKTKKNRKKKRRKK